MVPWSVGRKMSRRATLWMSLLQDPWAWPQQSVAWNESAIVGEKGNSTLADTQKKGSGPTGPLSAWSVLELAGSTQRSLFGKKRGGKWLCVVSVAQRSDTVHLFMRRIWMIVEGLGVGGLLFENSTSNLAAELNYINLNKWAHEYLTSTLHLNTLLGLLNGLNNLLRISALGRPGSSVGKVSTPC